VPEEAKRELEEIKREILELRSRIEKWAMVKIADVGEMNTVYRKLGILARKLAMFNPNPEAVKLREEVERLMKRVEELRARAPTVTIPPVRSATSPTPPKRPEVSIPVARPAGPPVVPPPSPPPVVRPKTSGPTAVGPETSKPVAGGSSGAKSPEDPPEEYSITSTGPCGWGVDELE
jgi:polyhydroxyalkanoate synthesis regulator phasin